MRVTPWTPALLRARAQRHDDARWEAEAEITALTEELRAVQARLADAEEQAARRCRMAYVLREWARQLARRAA